MTPQDLINFAEAYEIDVSKLQAIREDGSMLGERRLHEKGKNLLEMANHVKLAGEADLPGGVDENGITRSPDDAQHRINASVLNRNLSPVLTTIAKIQSIETGPEAPIAEVERRNLGRLLERYKAAETTFQQQDQAQKQQRERRYQDAISTAFTPALQEQGFSQAEVRVATTALTKTFLEVEGNAPNSVHYANESARQLSEAYQNSAFDLSSFKPGATKIEDAVCKSFDARVMRDPDGEMKIKGGTSGFRLRHAETASAEAAEAVGLRQEPMRRPHHEMEPRSTYHVGGTLTAHRSDGANQQAQASETFRVTSSTPMNQQGESTAFAKRMVGARTADLKLSNADETALMRSAMKDSEQIGTIAPLFGTAEVVGRVDAMNPDGKIAVLGGQVESLPVRSVASSAVNEALGMNSVSKEAFGIDTSNQPVGLSVAAAGAPMLSRPSDARSQEAFLNVDYSDPQIQKGLYDLEAQDYITGQIDRHPGNIFIDPHTKEVVGIDNDLAFPTVNREEMIQKDGGISGKAVAGMPTLLHSETADRIEAMQPEVLREALQGIRDPQTGITMEPAAIDGAVQRLENLQQEIKTMRLEGRVVDAFTPEHYQQAEQQQVAKLEDQSLGSQGAYASERTSYVGSAILLQARTEELNNKASEVYKAYNERTITEPAMVPVAGVDELHDAYQNGIQAAKQDLQKNLEKIEDVGLAGQIHKATQAVDNLEEELANHTRDMKALEGPARNSGGEDIERFQAKQVTRQTTLQELAGAKRELDSLLDQAVEPLKTGIYRNTGLEVLNRQLDNARVEVEVAAAKLAPEPDRNSQQTWGSRPSPDAARRGGLLGSARKESHEQDLATAEAKLNDLTGKLERLDQMTAEPETIGQAMGRGRADSSAPALSQQTEAPAAEQPTIGSMMGGHRAAGNQPAGPRTDRSNTLG